MKIQRPSLSLTALALVVVILATGAFLWHLSNQNQATPEDQSTKELVEARKANAKPDKDSGLPENSSEISSDEVPVNNNLSLTISSQSQKNGKVNATATVNQRGTCVFQYTTDGDKPVIQEVSVDESMICKSSIPEISFSKLGTWQLKVTLYNEGSKIEATKSVELK